MNIWNLCKNHKASCLIIVYSYIAILNYEALLIYTSNKLHDYCKLLLWGIPRESTLKIFYDNFKKLIIKNFMKRKKEIGIKIQFDDKEYSKEEIEFLWERFIFILAEAQNIDFDPKITRNLIKTMISEIFKGTKETRTPLNTDE